MSLFELQQREPGTAYLPESLCDGFVLCLYCYSENPEQLIYLTICAMGLFVLLQRESGTTFPMLDLTCTHCIVIKQMLDFYRFDCFPQIHFFFVKQSKSY